MLKYPRSMDDGNELLLPSAKDIDSLLLLDAVLRETLRVYPSVPGRQPRMVPKACQLGGYDNILAGTTV
jgi:cytochrome P450